MARAYRYHAGPIPGQTTDAVSNPRGIFIAHRVYSISLRSSAGDWLDASQVYRRLPRHQLQRLMYILSTGCQWRALPKDLPPRSTVHDYLDLWSYDGTLDRIHHALYAACREQSEREASPTAALSDFVPGHRPCRQSGFDLMAKGHNKRPISPCASVCGGLPSRPVHSPHGLSSSRANAGISSTLVRSRSLPCRLNAKIPQSLRSFADNFGTRIPLCRF